MRCLLLAAEEAQVHALAVDDHRSAPDALLAAEQRHPREGRVARGASRAPRAPLHRSLVRAAIRGREVQRLPKGRRLHVVPKTRVSSLHLSVSRANSWESTPQFKEVQQRERQKYLAAASCSL